MDCYKAMKKPGPKKEDGPLTGAVSAYFILYPCLSATQQIGVSDGLLGRCHADRVHIGVAVVIRTADGRF